MRGVAVAFVLLLAGCGDPSAGPATTAPPPAGAPTRPPTVDSPATTAPPGTTTTGRPPTTTTTVAAAATTTTTDAPTTAPITTIPPRVTVVLVGDVMLGRGVSRRAREEPESLFAGVAELLAGADIAAANLESPLTNRPHIAVNSNDVGAPPERAALLAGAGFDVAVVANNHATDSGRLTVTDTVAAVEAAGMVAVGGGPDRQAAFTPLVVDAGGVTVGFVAFDVTLAGWPATPSKAGVAHWEPGLAAAAVMEAAAVADVVVASIHGGIEYRTDTDRRMAGIAEQLVGWGADVVWGHGPHVVQPVYAVPGRDGRRAVVATSLGNFLFDMRASGTRTGGVLEITAHRGGALSYRVGTASHPDGVVVFDGWEQEVALAD